MCSGDSGGIWPLADVTDATVVAAAAGLPNVAHLDFENCNVTSDGQFVCATCPATR
jgi:hypothetical protein